MVFSGTTGQNRAFQDQAPLQRHRLLEPDYPRPHNLQAGLETKCAGSDRSPPRSLTSIAPAGRFTRRIIASERLFTQPRPFSAVAVGRRSRQLSGVKRTIDGVRREVWK